MNPTCPLVTAGALLLLGADADTNASKVGRARRAVPTRGAEEGGRGERGRSSAAAGTTTGTTTRGDCAMERKNAATRARTATVGMKNADHRRLIYRWTNALVRCVGLKVPSGAGALFSKDSKNKREKFDKFLSHYYGDDSFAPGKYWYSNACAPKFFIEVFYNATEGRVRCREEDIFEIFTKIDPNRQASTWSTSIEALNKFGITRDEVLMAYSGKQRVENGWPKGQPLCIPQPDVLPGSAKRDGNAADLRQVSDAGTRKRPKTAKLKAKPDFLDAFNPIADSFGQPSRSAERSALSLVEEKALNLCKRVQPGEETSPMNIMRPIFDEILEGLGPKCRPCERNQINSHYASLLPREVISQDDVVAALRIKEVAYTVVDPFKNFTKAYFKLKLATERHDKAADSRDKLESEIDGSLMVLESVSSSEGVSEDKLVSKLESTVKSKQQTLLTVKENLESLAKEVSVADSELEETAAVVRGPYLSVVRKCYELGAAIQNRMEDNINLALKSVRKTRHSQRTQCEVMAQYTNNVSAMDSMASENKAMLARESELQSLQDALQVRKQCFAYALNTLDQRWAQFNIRK